jgi:flagellar basal body P-ring formation protein FlgA
MMRVLWCVCSEGLLGCLLPLLLSGALIPTAAVAQTASTVLRVELQSSVEAQSANLTLGDIAFVSSVDLGLLRRALLVPLGRAPRPGTTTVLDSVRLGYWIRSRLGLRPDQIVWDGADSVVLSTTSQTMPGTKVVAAAQAALASHLSLAIAERGLQPVRMELQPIGEPGEILVPAGGADVIVRPLKHLRPSSRMVVWVDVLTNGVPVKAIPVRFEVGVFARAPVAADAMAAGAVLSSEDLQWHEVDVAALSAPAVAGATAEKLRLRHAVAAGELITEKHVTALPAVSRGDMVRLVSQSGLVRLESKVEVLQDGRVGELVRARPVNASGAVMARVVAPGHLEFQQ